MERNASAPAVGSGTGERQGRPKYNIKQFRGIIDDVALAKTVVEKERAQALEQNRHVEKLFNERDAEAQLIQKELSVQLRCAGRSYQQILDANRQISEDLQAEAERRRAEVSALEQQVHDLTAKVESTVKPWKEEVNKRDLRILKMQESAVDLDKQLREALLALPREREKLTSEIDTIRKARDELVKEYGALKGQLDSIEEVHSREKEDVKLQARKDCVELQHRMDEVERTSEEQKRRDAEEIHHLNLQIKGLTQERQMDKREHERYDRKLELKEDGFAKMVHDWKVKTDSTHEQAEQMRANYERTITRMDEQLQEAERECQRKLKPWQELAEKNGREIKNLRDKYAEGSRENARLLQREQELEEELEKRLAAANGALELAQVENYKLQRTVDRQQEEANDSNFGDRKRLGVLEIKLLDTVEQTRNLLAKRDIELQEKVQMIQNLQGKVREQALQEGETDKVWDERVQAKEEGYGAVVAQLMFAEGQIEEERGRTMNAIKMVRKRERSIERLKAEHKEELKTRTAEHEALLLDNGHWAGMVDDLEAEREASERRWEALMEARDKRQDDREADLRIEMMTRDEAVAEMEKTLQGNKEHFDKSKSSWEDKERELEMMLRSRDRTITGLKNEIEFIHESWELKYNRLMDLFDKLQKKFEDGVGNQGVLEVQRRAEALKKENQELMTQIKQLKEGIKKQKKQIRDLQIDIDMVTKETADVLEGKDAAMAELVGENVNLQKQLQAAYEEREATIRELKGEQVSLAESFQDRVVQLEQLVEAMRFTDRQALVDKIDVWKRAYERVAIARDDQEEEYKALVDTKDQQIGAVAEEYREVQEQIDRMAVQAEEDLDALNEKWKKEQAGWKMERLKLQQEVIKLQTQLEKHQKQVEVTMVQGEMQGSGVNSEEHDALKAKVQRQKVKKKALKAGVQELITENTDWRAKCAALEEQITASAENLEKFTKWRDERYEAMKKEYEAMKAILEGEMNTAQDSCKEIEEQVRQFPSPFEIELEELKARYAQTQAGILTMSLENAKLREEMKAQQDSSNKQLEEMEGNLKLAHFLLKEVGSAGDLKKLGQGQETSSATSAS